MFPVLEVMELLRRNCPSVLGKLLIWQLKRIFVGKQGSLRVPVALLVIGRWRKIRLDYKRRVVLVNRYFFNRHLAFYRNLLRFQEFIGFTTVGG
jgi:hypothetical protein